MTQKHNKSELIQVGGPNHSPMKKFKDKNTQGLEKKGKV